MNQYKLLTPGPLTTTDTVKAVMQVDHCTWDDDYKQITQRIRAQLLESDVKSAVEALRQSGLSKSEALALVERFWDQPSGKEQV